MKKETTYHVVINTGLLERWSKEFPDIESARKEVKRLEEDTTFKNSTFKAIKRTVIEEDI